MLSSSASGRAYLDLVRRYRPACDDLEATEIIELVTTYEAIELLGRLLNEPRCGGDPDFFLWKDVWGDQRPDPDEYTELIEIAVQMEAHASEEAAKARLRLVRENLERELELERYCRRKELLVRQTGRMGGSVALRS